MSDYIHILEIPSLLQRIDVQLNELYYVKGVPLLKKVETKHKKMDGRRTGEFGVMQKMLEKLCEALDDWKKHVLYHSLALKPYKDLLLRQDEERVLTLFDLLLRDAPSFVINNT